MRVIKTCTILVVVFVSTFVFLGECQCKPNFTVDYDSFQKLPKNPAVQPTNPGWKPTPYEDDVTYCVKYPKADICAQIKCEADPSGDECDKDGDGILNEDDECPDVAADTENGCPVEDDDDDGEKEVVIDACVAKPSAPGCDEDKDGIPNELDACPVLAESYDLSSSAPVDGLLDGCPDVGDDDPIDDESDGEGDGDDEGDGTKHYDGSCSLAAQSPGATSMAIFAIFVLLPVVVLRAKRPSKSLKNK